MSDRIFNPGQKRPGDPITAADRNARNAAILRGARMSGSGGIGVREGTLGRSLVLTTPETAYIKLTTTANSDGGYGAKEVVATPLGTWIDAGRIMPQSGDPVYERNHNVSLSSGDRVYLARRAATTGEWIFARTTSSGGGGGTGVLLGCTCRFPPIDLTMTVSTEGCSNGLFNSCTISYQTTPSSLTSLRLGTSCYLSNETFNDTQTGDLYHYYLACFTNIIRISRVFPTSVYGSPFLDSVIYFWTLGLPGNTCSPFSLTNGSVFAGGDASCAVTIEE